jgi:fructosamine-3-kinase
MDLGMSLLFGGFSNRFYEAYHSFFPIESGWRKRVTLTQLYPLLVHAILFGGGYVSQCKTILKNWGS